MYLDKVFEFEMHKEQKTMSGKQKEIKGDKGRICGIDIIKNQNFVAYQYAPSYLVSPTLAETLPLLSPCVSTSTGNFSKLSYH